MLTKALKWESSAQGYKFTQIPELIHCLLVSGPCRGPAHPALFAGTTRGEEAEWAGSGAATMPSPTLPFQGVLQKEPNFLATLLRQKIILVIVGLR